MTRYPTHSMRPRATVTRKWLRIYSTEARTLMPRVFGATGLHWAAMNGHVETAELLVHRGANSRKMAIPHRSDAAPGERKYGRYDRKRRSRQLKPPEPNMLITIGNKKENRWHLPSVMNTQEQLRQAMTDSAAGNVPQATLNELGRWRSASGKEPS
jgi:hypothetical protein